MTNFELENTEWDLNYNIVQSRSDSFINFDDPDITNGYTSNYIITKGTGIDVDQDVLPYYNYISSSSTTITIGNPKYSILNLPCNDHCPIAVYVCGRMVTLGIIGTAVECAFVGDKLIFEPGVVHQTSLVNERITISVEYKDKIYHYNVGIGGVVNFACGTTLDAVLVSTIEK
ncbi:hypothetical protein LCGC14_1638020 [marine sediment metagenome]|uniref:Uncharacterized protein n=1 Tax=marine sediment metagenome TaxID=412755 RepID=A0A0F9IMZ7_9ZZZZ